MLFFLFRLIGRSEWVRVLCEKAARDGVQCAQLLRRIRQRRRRHVRGREPPVLIPNPAGGRTKHHGHNSIKQAYQYQAWW